MLIETWYYQLLRTIPEAIAIVSLGTALIKLEYNWKRIVLAGVILGTVGFALQQIPFKYGVHVPLGIIVAMFTLSLVFKINMLKSATASLLSFILLVFIEWLTMLVQISLFGFSEEKILNSSELVRFSLSLPPLIIYIMLAVFVQLRFSYSMRRAKDQA